MFETVKHHKIKRCSPGCVWKCDTPSDHLDENIWRFPKMEVAQIIQIMKPGLGAEKPMVTWGSPILKKIRTHMGKSWWTIKFSGYPMTSNSPPPPVEGILVVHSEVHGLTCWRALFMAPTVLDGNPKNSHGWFLEVRIPEKIVVWGENTSCSRGSGGAHGNQPICVWLS